MLPDRYPEILSFQPLIFFNSLSIKSAPVSNNSDLNNSLLGMIVAQYSVHAIAGLKPDYGIHFPNIRSPEDG
jgi:hypothetical protein